MSAGVTIDEAGFRILVVVGPPVRVGEQLHDRYVQTELDLAEAPHAFTGRFTVHRAADQHTFHHRFEPQVQLEAGAFGHPHHVRAQAFGYSHGESDRAHGAGTPAEFPRAENERRPGVGADGALLETFGSVVPTRSGETDPIEPRTCIEADLGDYCREPP